MKFSEITVGLTETLKHTITQDDVCSFIRLTGDDNTVHTRKGGIVHGMLTASYISTLIGKQLPGDGAIWQSQELVFAYPVYVGDLIVVRGEVSDIFEDNTIKLITDVYNTNGRCVIYGTSIVKCPE